MNDNRAAEKFVSIHPSLSSVILSHGWPGNLVSLSLKLDGSVVIVGTISAYKNQHRVGLLESLGSTL